MAISTYFTVCPGRDNLTKEILNINDADAFSLCPFFKNVIFAYEFMHRFLGTNSCANL